MSSQALIRARTGRANKDERRKRILRGKCYMSGKRIARSVLVKAVTGIVALLLAVMGAAVLFSAHAFEPPDEQAFQRKLKDEGLIPLMRNAAERVVRGEQVSLADPAMQPLIKAGVQWWAPDPWKPRAPGDPIEGIFFEFGGADRHYGVIVTQPSRRPALSGWHVRAWEDDLWFYSELPSHGTR